MGPVRETALWLMAPVTALRRGREHAMVHHGMADLAAQPTPADMPEPFAGLLSAQPAGQGESEGAGEAAGAEAGDLAFVTDLCLDQVVEAVAGQQRSEEHTSEL